MTESMTPLQVVQYQASGIAVFEGAELPEFEMEMACYLCEQPVNMLATVEVSWESECGSMVTRKMAEGQARALMAAVGIVPPPVLCSNHEHINL